MGRRVAQHPSSSTTPRRTAGRHSAAHLAPAPAPAAAPAEASARAVGAHRAAGAADARPAPAPAAPAAFVRPVARGAQRGHGEAALPRRARSEKGRGRLTGALASGAALALVPALMFALPAAALPSTVSSAQASASVSSGHPSAEQILKVAGNVSEPSAQRAQYIATALSAIVADQGNVNTSAATSTMSQALQVGGERQTIVETALSYLGDPYVLGGASHSGIDCSGLTMVAYAAVGISLVHYVPTQDAAGTVIDASQAQPGDLIVFDDEEHVGIYLGNGMLINAPDVGRPVQIVPVSDWSGIGYHFTRILPS